MAKSTGDNTKKKRPAQTGTLVGVRLQPDMLEALDRLAQDTSSSRPEALRFAFAQWAEANGFAAYRPRLKERQIMIDLWQKELDALTAEFGSKYEDLQDGISAIVRSYLRDKGHIEVSE